MENEFISDLERKIRSLPHLHGPSAMLGCTLEEIELIKNAQNVTKLPHIYEQFLLHMGKGAGILYRGFDYTFKDLLALKSDAEFYIKKHGNLPLPSDAFVFFYDAADTYCWFHTEENDNPAVFKYEDTVSGFPKVNETLSEFYLESYTETARILLRL